MAILPRYLLLIVAPLHLSADYSYRSIPPVMSPWDLWFIAGLACVAALIALPWVVRSHFLVFASAFFGACLLPVANLFFLAPSGMAERYLHLAMIPVALTWGWAGQCWLRRSPGQRRLIWAVVLCRGRAGWCAYHRPQPRLAQRRPLVCRGFSALSRQRSRPRQSRVCLLSAEDNTPALSTTISGPWPSSRLGCERILISAYCTVQRGATRRLSRPSKPHWP